MRICLAKAHLYRSLKLFMSKILFDSYIMATSPESGRAQRKLPVTSDNAVLAKKTEVSRILTVLHTL